jgi:hypothetical protein
MNHTEFSFVDITLVSNLRSRRVPNAETEPAKRCKIVSGWPVTSREMVRLSDRLLPLEADFPNYSDVDKDADVEAFISCREISELRP